MKWKFKYFQLPNWLTLFDESKGGEKVRIKELEWNLKLRDNGLKILRDNGIKIKTISEMKP